MRFFKHLLFKVLCKVLPYAHVVRGPSNITTEKDTRRVVVPQVKQAPELDEKVVRLVEMEKELSAWQELLKMIRRAS